MDRTRPGKRNTIPLMAYGYYLEAEYQDGFVHREDDDDESPYVPGKNIYNDIIEKRPEAEHGPMVRFSFVGSGNRYDIDWQTVPADARPIYYRNMQLVRNIESGEQTVSCLRHVFGYQWTDGDGKNQQEILEL